MTLGKEELAMISSELERVYTALLNDIRDEQAVSTNQDLAALLDRAPTVSEGGSVADALADLNVELIDRHVQGIRDVEAARQRMAEGSYGICIECGQDVGLPRLLAYPTAKRCIGCQQTHEKMYARTATPRL